MSDRRRDQGRSLRCRKDPEDGIYYDRIYVHDLGTVIDKSDFTDFAERSEVKSISIPDNVEWIQPCTFTDFVCLTDVEIRGEVYGVVWHGGTDFRWTAPLSPATLVEELKRGTGRIEIIRK